MNVYDLTEQEGKDLLEESGVVGLLSRGDEQEIPPKWDDLARLYGLVRTRKPFQILEFRFFDDRYGLWVETELGRLCCFGWHR